MTICALEIATKSSGEGDSPVPSGPRTESPGGYTHPKPKLFELPFGFHFSQNSGFCSFSSTRYNPAAQGKAQR